MIVVDDDFVRQRLLGNGQLLTRFPFLNAYRSQLQNLDELCVTCSGAAESKQKRLDLLNSIRQTIASLTAPEWSELKVILGYSGTQSILVAYRTRVNNQARIESKVC